LAGAGVNQAAGRQLVIADVNNLRTKWVTQIQLKKNSECKIKADDMEQSGYGQCMENDLI
jgi:hypothetical protein